MWDRYDRQERLYKKNIERYELAEEYDKQMKDLIIETFPGSANARMEGGMHLPDHVTSKQLLTDIITRSEISEASRNCGRIIYNRFGDGPTGHTYKPNPIGPSAFFKAVDKDLKLAKQLNEDSINYNVAMKKAKEAFWKCGHEKIDLNRLETEWEAKAKMYQGKDGEVKYDAYKTFYTKELMRLYTYKPVQQERAYKVEDLKDYVQGELSELQDQCNDLASAFHTAAQSKAPDIPATIETGTRDTSMLTDSKYTAFEAKIEAKYDNRFDTLTTLVREALQQNRNNQHKRQTTSPNRQRNYQWRPFVYCWTHGICSHTSTNCRTPGPGHQNEATFQNKMEGNTKGTSNWGKWLSPKGRVHDSKGDE
jgi:hypothetical protein